MSYLREAVTSHLASPWRFRDGNEYLVSLSISDKPKWASISLQDKITAEEWSGQFDLKCKSTLVHLLLPLPQLQICLV